MQQLKKHTNKLVLMFDNDDAGAKAFNRSLPELLNIGFQVDKAVYPGKDPDEYFQKLIQALNPQPLNLSTNRRCIDISMPPVNGRCCR
jgi:hypothetical protein